MFTYLFQPVNLEAVFPFIIQNNFSSTYLGRTILENTYGGVFAANLILLRCLCCRGLGNTIRRLVVVESVIVALLLQWWF